MIYVAPTEPAELRDVADVVSTHPERFGVDVLIVGKHNSIGVQRKTVSDLVASLEDGRLAEQSALMSPLIQDGQAFILIEGQVIIRHGYLRVGDWGEQVSKRRFRRVLLTLQDAGWGLLLTDDIDDTVEFVELMDEWCSVENHSTLTPVAKKVAGDWGEQKARHYQLQMLMALPGVGKGLAERILDTVGFPLRLIPGIKDVQGIGQKKYDKILEVVEEEE